MAQPSLAHEVGRSGGFGRSKTLEVASGEIVSYVMGGQGQTKALCPESQHRLVAGSYRKPTHQPPST